MIYNNYFVCCDNNKVVDFKLLELTKGKVNQKNSDDWSLVWNDEFNGSEIDPNKWTFDIGNGEGGWGNNELQYYTDRSDNVKVEDGNLVITALYE